MSVIDVNEPVIENAELICRALLAHGFRERPKAVDKGVPGRWLPSDPTGTVAWKRHPLYGVNYRVFDGPFTTSAYIMTSAKVAGEGPPNAADCAELIQMGEAWNKDLCLKFLGFIPEEGFLAAMEVCS